jgi:hypothetical protein
MKTYLRLKILFILIIVVLQSCAQTQTRSLTTRLFDDYQKNKKILLLPVDIELSELSIGGIPQVKADWSENATNFFNSYLREKLNARNVELIEYSASKSKENQEVVSQLVKLSAALGTALYYHEFIPGNQLPLKKEFDWNLGPSSAVLKRQYDADYALLIFVRDSYSSGERVMFQVLSALLLGYIPAGGVQAGYASLLDLNKGKIVWYNHLYREVGDLRNEEGANESVGLFLKSFPE